MADDRTVMAILLISSVSIVVPGEQLLRESEDSAADIVRRNKQKIRSVMACNHGKLSMKCLMEALSAAKFGLYIRRRRVPALRLASVISPSKTSP